MTSFRKLSTLLLNDILPEVVHFPTECHDWHFLLSLPRTLCFRKYSDHDVHIRYMYYNYISYTMSTIMYLYVYNPNFGLVSGVSPSTARKKPIDRLITPHLLCWPIDRLTTSASWWYNTTTPHLYDRPSQGWPCTNLFNFKIKKSQCSCHPALCIALLEYSPSELLHSRLSSSP